MMALPTRSIQHLYDVCCSPVCRLCGEQSETVEHIICGCKFLAATQYKSRHVSVAKLVHWWLCQANLLPQSAKWWDHVPLPVIENDSTKLLWDFNIHGYRPLRLCYIGCLDD